MEKNIIENIIEATYRDISMFVNDEYIELYDDIENETLKLILSTLHAIITEEYRAMNGRLPTENNEAHFWADNSRKLLFAINTSFNLERKLKDSEFAIVVDDYYKTLMLKCRDFLSTSGGSAIPPHMEKVELYYKIKIFNQTNTKQIKKRNSGTYKLQLIGSGSYAVVYKYFDEDYDETFVLKKLKSNVLEKDKERFVQEFTLMKTNPHPNIVKVYKYFENNNSYTMEYCGIPLKKFIDKNNTKLTISQREYLIHQLFNGINFLHKKGLYHRDISYNNILIDIKQDFLFLKISDFGLIKDEKNPITNSDSSIKGTYRDPCLENFKDYNAQNDIYALGMMINYIYYGRENIKKGKDIIDKVIEKCTILDLSIRYMSIDEIVSDLFCNNQLNTTKYDSIGIQELKENIVSKLSNYSANQLPDLCLSLGLGLGTQSDAFKSKRVFIENMLFGFNKKQTVDLIIKIKENLGIDIID